jgi:energy-converting hydrogenase Eha subunit H
MFPRHALSSIMVWDAGVGPWWAATAEILRKAPGSGQPLRVQTLSTNKPRWNVLRN